MLTLRVYGLCKVKKHSNHPKDKDKSNRKGYNANITLK